MKCLMKLSNPHIRERLNVEADISLLGFFALLHQVDLRQKREAIEGIKNEPNKKENEDFVVLKNKKDWR